MASKCEVEWSHAQSLQLIELYREKEVFWNPRIADFQNKKKKNYAWIEMANELKMAKNKVQLV